MLKGELIFSILIFVGSLLLYWVTGSFQGRTVLQDAQMGPTFWPRVILSAIILLSGIVSVGTIPQDREGESVGRIADDDGQG